MTVVRRGPLVALTLAGVLFAATCDGADWRPLAIPDTVRTPDLAGVIDVVELRSGPPLIRLEDGTTYDPTGAAVVVRRGGLERGSLLLAGNEPDRWYAHLDELVPGCYALVSRGRDDGATVVTEDGLRLTKAPGFRAPHDQDGVYDRLHDQFCLGPDGLVTGYGLIR